MISAIVIRPLGRGHIRYGDAAGHVACLPSSIPPGCLHLPWVFQIAIWMFSELGFQKPGRLEAWMVWGRDGWRGGGGTEEGRGDWGRHRRGWLVPIWPRSAGGESLVHSYGGQAARPTVGRQMLLKPILRPPRWLWLSQPQWWWTVCFRNQRY